MTSELIAPDQPVETPWMTDMASTSGPRATGGGNANAQEDQHHHTTAAFSPVQPTSPSNTKRRSAILVHQKSPLLVATPPAVTRALAFSHPFILPLNRILGLVTWSSGDPWESFLLVASFWGLGLYGDKAINYAGPVILVIGLILLMFSRRYSPLSSTGWTGEKDASAQEGGTKHQKSLDEILDVLNSFTSRCNLLLEPFLQLTEFLSTQRTATSATTRPALTSLFVRILFLSPVWIALTLPPLRVLTTKRVVLAAGTVVLSWHSRPARVSRTLLWRSRLVRRSLSIVTGLRFSSADHAARKDARNPPPLPPRSNKPYSQHEVASSLATSGSKLSAGVRFTFAVYENQRRWLGLGWTYSLLAYERAAWTDQNLNPSDTKDDFKLPEVQNGAAEWRWVEGSEWKVDLGAKSKSKGNTDGWIYYDNKWSDGRRGQDGWGRYTRRRKWYRDAELVEIDPNNFGLDWSTDTLKAVSTPSKVPGTSSHKSTPSRDSDDISTSQPRRRGLFRRRDSGRSAQSSGDFSATTTLRNDENDNVLPNQHEQDSDWKVGDEVKMGLG